MQIQGIRWKQLTFARRIQIVAAVIWCIAFLAGPFWWGARVRERKQLMALYSWAAGGSLDAVKQLDKNNSSEAIHLLEALALDPSAFADARVAAISALGQRRFLDSDPLTPLLWIQQPFTVRHAAAGLFKRRGCDSDCISAVLYALHALWGGGLTAEDELSQEHPDLSPQIQAVARPLRKESEDDYIGLLARDPRLAIDTLRRLYSTESSFVERVEARIRQG